MRGRRSSTLSLFFSWKRICSQNCTLLQRVLNSIFSFLESSNISNISLILYICVLIMRFIKHSDNCTSFRVCVIKCMSFICSRYTNDTHELKPSNNFAWWFACFANILNIRAKEPFTRLLHFKEDAYHLYSYSCFVFVISS